VHRIEYAAPATLTAAVALLRERRGDVSILAGGTDIIVQAREGRRRPALLLDVKKIPELTAIRAAADGGLSLGAAVPCARLCANEDVARLYPVLIEAAGLIGGTAIQSRASLGGNLCNASPAADSIPALIALGAVCEIAGPMGRRELTVDEMCTEPGANALGDDELLVALRLPAPAPNSGAAFERFTPRNEMDIAVCNCAASVTLSADRSMFVSGRIALGAVGPTPLLAEEASVALAGKPATSSTIERIAEVAATAARPITDMRGSAAQRRHLAKILTRRVMERAVARAKGAQG
jgi:CO/xanthine dehydrogenase FAD-binding subunit